MSNAKKRLKEAQSFMKDFALPPGLGVGIQDDGHLVVVREATSEIMELDATEEDIGNVSVSLWREYLNEAPPAILVRFVQCVLAVDALLAHDGEMQGSPRDPEHDGEGNAHNYKCTLWGKEGDPSRGCGGYNEDPVNAILDARRALNASLEKTLDPEKPLTSGQKAAAQELTDQLNKLPAFQELKDPED
mgnify:CR=1 FL=1